MEPLERVPDGVALDDTAGIHHRLGGAQTALAVLEVDERKDARICGRRLGAPAGDSSTPAVWFPFQDTATKNHIGVWSVKVGGYTIP